MQPPLDRIPHDVVSLGDYESWARDTLHNHAWAYLSGAAADELTLQDNRAAFDRIKLNPRVLTPLAGGHTRVSLFGHEFPSPVVLAPVAYQKLFHPQGELATALGAAAVGAGMIVSQQASTTFEDIAATAPAPRWLQLYLQGDRALITDLVSRAEAAGFLALVVTVDAPVHGVRNREQRAAFHLPQGISAVNCPAPTISDDCVFGTLAEHAPTWDDIVWLKSITRLPVLVKGILHPDDAILAREHGVDGLIVSNHGGRTLDTLPATMDALPRIAQTIGNDIPILLDGGIRRGTDVLKAIALGATAVLIGRPYIHALACAGAVGVAHVLKILQTELEVALALTGRRTLADVNSKVLWP